MYCVYFMRTFGRLRKRQAIINDVTGFFSGSIIACALRDWSNTITKRHIIIGAPYSHNKQRECS